MRWNYMKAHYLVSANKYPNAKIELPDGIET